MAKTYLFPEVISVTLYKYNSIDCKLYTLILDNCLVKPYQDTILVKKEDVNILLSKYFKKEINNYDKAIHNGNFRSFYSG